MNTQADTIVYIGRFQPAHKAHIETIQRAALVANKRVIILVGSSNQPRTIKNPWKWDERADMIRASLTDSANEKVIILPVRDNLYDENSWIKNVQDIINFTVEDSDIVKIIGYSKDETSYYIKSFPQWETIEIENIDDLHATDIRNAMFENENFEIIGKNLPDAIHDYIKSFMLTSSYDNLLHEYSFIQKYKSAWNDAPYPPTFITVDSIVVCAGHLLMVKRKSEPGKNLWALPGGFVNQNEKLKDAMIRELREETRLAIPPKVLHGSIIKEHVFDDPSRSLRGRTITHAYYIDIGLDNGKLPKIKANDDAVKAKWIPLSVISKMEEQFFEDHFSMISLVHKI